MNHLKTVILGILAFCLTITYSQEAQATNPVGTANQVQISGQMCFGTQSVYPNILFQYQEPGTTTAYFGGSTTVSVAANTTNNTIDTATLFPGITTPVAFVLQEITQPSQQLNVGLDSDGARLSLNPQGFLFVRVASGLPTFYVDNPSESQGALIQVSYLSN